MTLPAIQFYHMLTTPLERALPKLMEKAQGAGMRVVIRGTPSQVETLDKALWTYDPGSFLAHGTATDDDPGMQPVYLTSGDETPNQAAIEVLLDGRSASKSGFERAFDVFDGGDETSLSAARSRWKSYLDAGHPLTYIRQKDDGGWEKVKEA